MRIRNVKRFLPAALVACGCALAPVAGHAKTPQSPITITWLGHATFVIASESGTRVLIDPFLKNNPATPEHLKDLKQYRLDAIAVTHSHRDHVADLVELATLSGAPVAGTAEYVRGLDIPDDQKRAMNIGGSVRINDDVSIDLVPAMHSSEPSGRPVGIILTFPDGRTVYHTGDTWIFGDMELIHAIYTPDIILLSTGGGPYGQNPPTAARAIKNYFKPTVIIPMHFGTFPVLSQEDAVRQAFKGDKRVRFLTPGKAVTY